MKLIKSLLILYILTLPVFAFELRPMEDVKLCFYYTSSGQQSSIGGGSNSDSGGGGGGGIPRDDLDKISDAEKELAEFEAWLDNLAEDAMNNNYLQDELFPVDPFVKEYFKDFLKDNGDSAPDTEGDPVFITTGQYVCYNTDTSFKWGKNNFLIERNYRSDEFPEGLFGKAWFCSLDTRIIFDNRKDNNILEELNNKKEKIEHCCSVIKNYKSLFEGLYTKGIEILDKCETLISFYNEEKNPLPENLCSEKYDEESVIKSFPSYTKGQIIHVSPNGGAVIFYYDKDELCFKPVNKNARNKVKITFSENDQTFCVKNISGYEMYYSVNGKPLYLKDRYGLTVEYCYENEKLTCIKHNNNIKMQFSYNNENLIEKIENKVTKNIFKYEYTDGLLTKYIDEVNDIYLFEYDSDNFLTVLVKPDGSRSAVCYEEIIDGNKRKVAGSHIDEDGNIETFEYDFDERKIQYTDADGDITLYEFDEYNNITKQILPDCTVNEWKYDENGNLIEKTDEYSTRTFVLNKFGDRIEEYEGNSVKKWNYETNYNLINKIQDSEGNTYSYLYDSKGNCILIQRNNSSVYSSTYNDWGAEKEILSINENNIYGYNENYLISFDKNYHYEYDQNNRISKKILPDGSCYRYSYSEDGKTTRCTTPQKLTVSVTINNRKDIEEIVLEDKYTDSVSVKKINYDKRHNVKEIFEATGSTLEEARKKLRLKKSFEYSAAGKLKSEIKWNYGKARINDAAGIKTEYIRNPVLRQNIEKRYFVNENEKIMGEYTETVYSYSYENGKMIRKIQNGNFVKEYDTDRNNNVLLEKQNEINLNSYEYNSEGLINSVINIFGGKTDYKYNKKNGLLYSISDENGNENRFDFNNSGNLIKTIEYDGFVTDYVTKELAGTLKTEKSTNLGKEINTYDKLGRLLSFEIKDSNNQCLSKTTLKYDDSKGEVSVVKGNVTKIYKTDSYGRCIYDPELKEYYEYDLNGNISRIIKNKGKKSIETVFEYNSENKISYLKKPGGNEINYFYNANGDLIKITDAAGLIWTGRYNEENNIIEETGRNLPVKRYEYDENGMIKSVYEGEEKILSYNYSENFRKCETVDARNNIYTEYLDAYGNTSSIKNRENQIMSISYRGMETEITDFNGNLKTIINNRNLGQNTTKYSSGKTDLVNYNAAGKIISFVNESSEEQFSYNEAGYLVKQIAEGKAMNYLYDDFGRKTSVTGFGIEEKFVYDEDGYMRRSYCNDIALAYIYDDDGNETSSYTENGIHFDKEYDITGRMISVSQKDAKGNIKFSENYLYDENGRIYCVTDNTGAVTLYEYDSRGRLVKKTMPYEKKFEEESRNELIECGEKVNTSFSVIPVSLERSLLMQLKKIWSKLNIRQPMATSGEKAWIETYVYDGNNNRIEKTTPLGTIHYYYDKENRLTYYGNKKPVSFEYDKNGNMISKNSVYKSEIYTYTEDNRIAEVLNYDKRSKKYENINYTYDALGRRITKTKNGRQLMRTVYEGLSLNPLTQYRKSGKFSSKTAEGLPLASETYYPAQRVFFYKDNLLRGQMSGNNSYIFCNDIRGSVRTVNFTSGALYSSISYSTDGTPFVKKSDSFIPILAEELSVSGLDMLFAGKEYDSSSSLYNFGYRDYAPSVAGFTSSDPIRDGINWYGYCAGDPVNFVDKWGLEIITTETTYTMNSESCKDIELGFGKDKIGEVGCVLLEYTRMASSIINQPIDPGYANEVAKENNLFTPGKDGQVNEMTIDNGVKLVNTLLENFGSDESISLERQINTKNKDTYNSDYAEVEKALTECEISTDKYVVGARIKTNNGKKGKEYQEYEHSMNVDEAAIRSEDEGRTKNLFFDDTSGVRTKLKKDTRENDLLRIDIFKVNTNNSRCGE